MRECAVGQSCGRRADAPQLWTQNGARGISPSPPTCLEKSSTLLAPGQAGAEQRHSDGIDQARLGDGDDGRGNVFVAQTRSRIPRASLFHRPFFFVSPNMCDRYCNSPAGSSRLIRLRPLCRHWRGFRAIAPAASPCGAQASCADARAPAFRRGRRRAPRWPATGRDVP